MRFAGVLGRGIASDHDRMWGRRRSVSFIVRDLRGGTETAPPRHQHVRNGGASWRSPDRCFGPSCQGSFADSEGK